MLFRSVQAETDASGKEIGASDIHAIFQREYLDCQTPYAYQGHRMSEESGQPALLQVDLAHQGQTVMRQGSGNGPIDAFIQALGLDIKVMDYHEHAISAGANAQAACYVELRLDNGPTLFGVGIDSNIVTASFKAVLSGLNRHIALGEKEEALAAA